MKGYRQRNRSKMLERSRAYEAARRQRERQRRLESGESNAVGKSTGQGKRQGTKRVGPSKKSDDGRARADQQQNGGSAPSQKPQDLWPQIVVTPPHRKIVRQKSMARQPPATSAKANDRRNEFQD